MLVICTGVFIAIWLEHLLLLGPAYHPAATGLPLRLNDGLISLGFLGLMMFAVTSFLSAFPDIVGNAPGEVP